jgi:hypothetical protein
MFMQAVHSMEFRATSKFYFDIQYFQTHSPFQWINISTLSSHKKITCKFQQRNIKQELWIDRG